jgi:hypothetical protein
VPVAVTITTNTSAAEIAFHLFQTLFFRLSPDGAMAICFFMPVFEPPVIPPMSELQEPHSTPSARVNVDVLKRALLPNFREHQPSARHWW